MGEYQADAFAGHDHGQHRHTYNDVYWSEVPAHGLNPNVDIGDDGPRNSPGHHGGGGYSSDRDNDGFGWDRQSHESVVPASGGLETRPKNIAVNYYIKICNCRTPNCR